MVISNLKIFNEISGLIIKEQSLIIGPLAWIEARKITGLNVLDEKKALVDIVSNNPQEIVNNLVAQYERLFGKLSHEICKEAAHNLVIGLSEEDVPSSLR